MSFFIFVVAGALAGLTVFALTQPTRFDASFGLAFWAIQAAFLGYLFWHLQAIGEFDMGFDFLDQLLWKKYIREERLNLTKWIIGFELFCAAYLNLLSRLSQKVARDAEIRRITG